MSHPEMPLAPLPLQWRAFAVAQLVLLGIGWLMRPEVPRPEAEALSVLLAALTVPTSLVCWLVPKLLVAEKAADPRSRALARWTCAEAVGVYGLAVLMYGGPGWLGTALVGWGLALVGLARPEPEDRTNLLPEPAREAGPDDRDGR